MLKRRWFAFVLAKRSFIASPKHNSCVVPLAGFATKEKQRRCCIDRKTEILGSLVNRKERKKEKWIGYFFFKMFVLKIRKKGRTK